MKKSSPTFTYRARNIPVVSSRTGAGSDARETVEKLVAANKETSQAAVEVARKWATANPFVEIVKKNYEKMQPDSPKAKKEKAAV